MPFFLFKFNLTESTYHLLECVHIIVADRLATVYKLQINFF